MRPRPVPFSLGPRLQACVAAVAALAVVGVPVTVMATSHDDVAAAHHGPATHPRVRRATPAAIPASQAVVAATYLRTLRPGERASLGPRVSRVRTGSGDVRTAVGATGAPLGLSQASLDDHGVPAAAGAAYRRASSLLAPACQVPWTLLAGIGKVESDHGRYGGASIGPDGRVSPSIVGVALNGQGVAAIRDTDGGRYDGDTRWDRAVGPMQFIPSTWARWGRDANGDGVADPQNIQDAALAAGGYLCATSTDLSSEYSAAAAVRTYNDSDYYVALVLALARGYRTGVFDLPTPPPPPGPSATPATRSTKPAGPAHPTRTRTGATPGTPSSPRPTAGTTGTSTTPATPATPAQPPAPPAPQPTGPAPAPSSPVPSSSAATP